MNVFVAWTESDGSGWIEGVWVDRDECREVVAKSVDAGEYPLRLDEVELTFPAAQYQKKFHIKHSDDPNQPFHVVGLSHSDEPLWHTENFEHHYHAKEVAEFWANVTGGVVVDETADLGYLEK